MAFFHKCNIPLASHRDFKRDPASAKSLAVLYRIVAASGSLPQQNFDFGRRSDTPPCAQNDKQRLCFAIRVRKKRAIRESPLRKILKFVVGDGVAKRSLLASSRNERIPPNNQSACHPERRKTLAFCEVELPRVEPWRTSGSARPLGRCGIWLGVPVTCFHKCNIPAISHREL